jgi:hypothetical protein
MTVWTELLANEDSIYYMILSRDIKSVVTATTSHPPIFLGY